MYHVYMIVKEKRKSTLKEAQFIYFFFIFGLIIMYSPIGKIEFHPHLILFMLLRQQSPQYLVFNSGINTQKQTNTISKAYISALFFYKSYTTFFITCKLNRKTITFKFDLDILMLQLRPLSLTIINYLLI